MKKMLLLANLVLILTLLSACAGPGAGGQQSVAQSDKPRENNPVATTGDLEKLTADNRAFALDLYQQLRGQDGNLFYSPHSISIALAMTYAGARNATASQMAQALHFTLSGDSLHQALNALNLALQQRAQDPNNPNQANFQLNVVNALWGQTGYKFLSDYLDLLAVNYGAGMRLLDFQADPEAARQVINNWVAQQTADRIKDLIPPSTLDRATTLVLTNAIYFKAQWLNQFNPDITRDALFTLLDGSQINVPTMYISQEFGYYHEDSFSVVELPYTGGQVSMLLLVPDSGNFNTFEQNLTPAQWDAIRQGMKYTQVNLALPKFGFTSEINLNDSLGKLGMKDAFEPGTADFSGMDGSHSLFISAVLHKAFINLDEMGTEAAAATAVVVGKTSIPADQVDLKIDRPFLFAIQDRPTGEILFLGRVVNPAQ